jgi:hypothetical protein
MTRNVQSYLPRTGNGAGLFIKRVGWKSRPYVQARRAKPPGLR